VVLAVIGLVIIAVAAIILLLANEPEPAEPPCKPHVPCVLSRNPDALALGTVWESDDLGYSFEYPKFFTVLSEDGKSVQLGARSISGIEIQVWVTGARGSAASVNQLVTSRRNALSQRVLGLTEDDNSPDRVMTPSLGFILGDGGSFNGTLDSASGPSSPANVSILAAGDGKVNVVFSLLITGDGLDHDTIQSLRNATGVLIVNTVRYR
jgi:hypothetical protein